MPHFRSLNVVNIKHYIRGRGTFGVLSSWNFCKIILPQDFKDTSTAKKNKKQFAPKCVWYGYTVHMSAKIGLNYIINNNSKNCFLILYIKYIHSGKLIHLFYIAVNDIAPVNKNKSLNIVKFATVNSTWLRKLFNLLVWCFSVLWTLCTLK